MKYALALLLIALPASATEDWQARCNAEGGCFLITQRAYEHLVGEIEKLQRALRAMKQEQCT